MDVFAAKAQHHCGAPAHLGQIVGDFQDRQTLISLKTMHQFGDESAAGFIDAGRRFIHQQNVGFAHQRKCNKETLELAAGKSANGFTGNANRQTNRSERMSDQIR